MLEARLLHLEAEVRTFQAEGRFIESQKADAIGQLASGVAHDFNNIIAIVMGYSELMMEKLGTRTDLQSYLNAIQSAGQRAAGLTRQLLIFGRKQTVQLVVLDINEVLKDMEAMLQRLMRENIEMSIVPGSEVGRIRGDSGYIGQILINLAVNARDAMPRGGKLSIATINATLDENYASSHAGVNAGEYVMLSVSDTGTGMTDEVKAHLFEALFTTKPEGEGTGLGLATCRTIVQQSGGHIGVYSEVGVGTTFKIYFPRVDQPLEAAAGEPRTERALRGTETVLVVEDDPSVRNLACKVLEAQGYKVLSACNGAEALQKAREHTGAPICLAITDVIMPVMGGNVMAEWLQAMDPNLKILFSSGYTDDALSHHGVLKPGIEFIPKPYTPSALVRKVRELLDQPASPRTDATQGGTHLASWSGSKNIELLAAPTCHD